MRSANAGISSAMTGKAIIATHVKEIYEQLAVSATRRLIQIGCLSAYCAAIARGSALTTEALPEVISSWIHL